MVDHVLDGIGKMGFDPADIKYILISHGHLDHYGGVGQIQELSGARVATLEEDWELIEAAMAAPPRPNRPLGVPFSRDMVLEDGQTLTLGDTSLKVYKLPGHTPGAPSFEFTVYDNGTPYKAFLFGGPGQRNGVEGGRNFSTACGASRRNWPTSTFPSTCTATCAPIPMTAAVPSSSRWRSWPSASLATRISSSTTRSGGAGWIRPRPVH